MDTFIERHASPITGTLPCFDRVFSRGYLLIMSGAAIATFLICRGVARESLKAFLFEPAVRLTRHAQRLGARTNRLIL